MAGCGCVTMQIIIPANLTSLDSRLLVPQINRPEHVLHHPTDLRSPRFVSPNPTTQLRPALMSVSESLLKRRSVILSISAAAVIAVGAFTGASLKQGAQYQARVEEVKQQSLDSRIEK